MATPLPLQKRYLHKPSVEPPRLTELEKRLLNAWQKGFPLVPRPYAEIARRLGTSEALVLTILEKLQEQGLISRVGPVFTPRRVGVSTLAAMSVPEEELERVAAVVSSYEEVNHNYEREHHFNLWFVVTAPDEVQLRQVIEELEARTGHPVMDLPLEQQYHIDLGFPLWC